MAVDDSNNGHDKPEASSPDDSRIVEVHPAGDVLLSIFDHDKGLSYKYRVDSATLRNSSPYFDRLLHPNKFAEGARVSRQAATLKSKYGTRMADAPAAELPVVAVSDLGRISKVNSIEALGADFLRVLHGLELSTPQPPVPNLANLAIVADRFDAVAALARHVRRRKLLHALDAKTKRGAESRLSEERVRQKLLIGLLLDYGPWVSVYSKRLIVKGSSRWKSDASDDNEAALYWDLPQGVEDELMRRREFVLDAIQSLQAHFLTLYASGERQCRLGYDSSLQCDSFQLGEMVRFFHRTGTLPLQGSIFDAEGPWQYDGDIEALIDALRHCPEYQIDRNHHHCGLRDRLLPLLTLIHSHVSLEASAVDVGICRDCWKTHRTQIAWGGRPRTLYWPRIQPTDQTAGGGVCLQRHVVVRDMFTAVTRNWTDWDL